MRQIIRRIFTPAALSLLIYACALGQTRPVRLKTPYDKLVEARIAVVLDDLQARGDWNAARKSIAELFDQTVFYAPEDHPEALRQADFARRLLAQLRGLEPDQRLEMLKFLRASPDLAWDLMYLMPRGQKSAATFALLDRLRHERPTYVEPYASLTAAVCVVHQKPLEIRVNENTGKPIDPLDIFDYFVLNENRMFFGIRNVPPELLIHVVDVTGSIGELNWALANYQGNRNVGQRFFDIAYDYDSFRYGTPKQLTVNGFSLPNILRFGGVCIDQAYFATEIGKAIGVPTAIATGASADAAHAWVGFLEAGPTNLHWNFDTGRYEEYRGVRGNVLDPITRQRIPDCDISLTAEMIGTTAVARQNAAALADAAERLIDLESEPPPAVAPPEDAVAETVRRLPRTADTATELTLLEAALRQSVACVPAWTGIRDLAVADKLTPEQKGRWADLLVGFGAAKYPDFTLSIIEPMVATIHDPQQQDQAWSKLFTIFSSRFDLAATIRMRQAALLDANGQAKAAFDCYMDVINRYANAGPFVISALQAADRLLTALPRPDLALQLYDQTWHNIEQPNEMARQFMKESNWYRVGELYAAKLEDAGQTDKAAQVDALLNK
jgi:hypothetical protein